MKEMHDEEVRKIITSNDVRKENIVFVLKEERALYLLPNINI